MPIDLPELKRWTSLRTPHARLAIAIGLGTLPGACATYEALPLAQTANLATSLRELQTEVPTVEQAQATRPIDTRQPLGIDPIGLLAVLNDPELKSERGEVDAARASLLEASLLQNPSIGLDYAVLLGGPATSPSYTASLSEDVTALITYRARVRAERAASDQVNAEWLWREWEVAQKARLLALDLYWGDRSIDYTQKEATALAQEVASVHSAVAAGNLDQSALAPLQASQATVAQSLASLRLDQLKNWQALDALLGLAPTVRFSIAEPVLPVLPANLDPVTEAMPQHRPDLLALQLGYESANEQLRAAVLAQFPALVLGGSWSSDTSGVRSAGPTATFDLPLFNRNQGAIAQARANRLTLHEQYQARLDAAIADVRGLQAQAERLSADLIDARQSAASTEQASGAAVQSFVQGNLDAQHLNDYQNAALERQIAVAALERSLGEVQITLAVELGFGLPAARIVSPDSKGSP